MVLPRSLWLWSWKPLWQWVVNTAQIKCFSPEFDWFICGSSWLLIQRFLLSCSPGMSLISIGVHSLKVTFSWARQIGVSEEARMSQVSSVITVLRRPDKMRHSVDGMMFMQHWTCSDSWCIALAVASVPTFPCWEVVPNYWLTSLSTSDTALDPCHMDTCLPDVADLADTDSDISNVGIGTTEDAPELTVQVANCCQGTALGLGYPRLRASLRAHGWPCNQMWRFWTRSTTNLGTTIDPPAQCLTRYRRCQRTLHHYGWQSCWLLRRCWTSSRLI